MTGTIFYQRYKDYYGNGSRGHWGTYFQRLIDIPSSKPNQVNQLEAVIQQIKSSGDNYAAAFNFHLSSKALDAIKVRGQPCLQYIQLKVERPYIQMTSVYRSHDFLNKALGNYVGLCRLLNFISAETNLESKSLVCHSIHAEIMGSVKVVRQIKNGINQINLF